jgi:hypothetical protein
MNHPREWQAGEAFRFGVERAGRFVGLVDIDEIRDGWGELGYWLERAAWGCGYAAEAARAVVRFAFEEAGLSGLRSGHAADNAASGRAPEAGVPRGGQGSSAVPRQGRGDHAASVRAGEIVVPPRLTLRRYAVSCG